MAKFNISSPDFENGKAIPEKNSYDNENISPELNWTDVPEETKSFALIVDDPDAPNKTWVHWVVYNISPQIHNLHHGIAKKEVLENGITQGINDYKEIGYGGPKPPPGNAHRYFFKLYALNKQRNLKPGLTKDQLLHEIENDIIDIAELIGTYKNKNND